MRHATSTPMAETALTSGQQVPPRVRNSGPRAHVPCRHKSLQLHLPSSQPPATSTPNKRAANTRIARPKAPSTTSTTQYISHTSTAHPPRTTVLSIQDKSGSTVRNSHTRVSVGKVFSHEGERGAYHSVAFSRIFLHKLCCHFTNPSPTELMIRTTTPFRSTFVVLYRTLIPWRGVIYRQAHDNTQQRRKITCFSNAT